MMASVSTIVFGSTGRVGSIAARTAQQEGAKVFLAMRDVNKSIPGLTLEQEQQAGFERVHADLTKPDTVHDAIQKTQSKRAFLYLIFGAPDHMRSTIVALKEAGIEFVVFLSSHAVQGNLSTISPSNFIAWQHAQVELVLQEIFGAEGYAAVRPGYFASNSLRWKRMINEGEVKVPYPEVAFDWIAPEDIGRVCGNVLARRERPACSTSNSAIPLYGPEFISQRDAVGIIGRTIGKDLKVTPLDDQEGLGYFMQSMHLPEPAAKQLINILKTRAESDGTPHGSELDESVTNVRAYSRREPSKFQQWVEQNRNEFIA